MFTEAQTVFLEKWERGTSLNFVEFIEFCPHRCRRQQEALCRTRHSRFRMINFHVFLSVITKILLKLKPANMVIFIALKFFRDHYIGFCTTSLYKTISLDGIRVHLWSEEMEDWCCRSHAWLVSCHRSLSSQTRASNPALALNEALAIQKIKGTPIKSLDCGRKHHHLNVHSRSLSQHDHVRK